MPTFKLQRALFPADADVLAYDEHRRQQMTLPMTSELRRMFGDRVKIYCEAEIKNQTLKVAKVVPDRGW
jgi:hypothetical protein